MVDTGDTPSLKKLIARLFDSSSKLNIYVYLCDKGRLNPKRLKHDVAIISHIVVEIERMADKLNGIDVE